MVNPPRSLNAIGISVVRFPEETRDFLLIIRAGSDPRPSLFSKIPSVRGYDVVINYYSEPNVDDVLLVEAEGVVFGGLSKFHAAEKLATTIPRLSSYSGILLADDDIEFLFDLDDFFAKCVAESFDLAQPSLTQDSYSSFGITKHHPGLSFRNTNYVEVMAPYFSRRFFQQMLGSFSWSISTWGLDVYWGSRLSSEWTAAIIDDYQMRHVKPLSLDGPFYRYLMSIGVNPHMELRRMLDLIGQDTYTIRPNRFVYRDDTAWSAHNGLYSVQDCKSLEELAVQFESCDMVSFDIFSTLVTEPDLSPGPVLRFIGFLVDLLRADASDLVDKRKLVGEIVQRIVEDRDDVHIEDIYAHFLRAEGGLAVTDFVDSQILDLAIECRLLLPQAAGIEALKTAHQASKRVIAMSSTHFRIGFIDNLLRHCGIRSCIDEIYLSSGATAQEADAGLWDSMVRTERCSPMRWIHVGCNDNSDMACILKRGIRAYRYCGPSSYFEKGVLGDIYRP